MDQDFTAMYIERVSDGDSPPSILLREDYKEDGEAKKRTLVDLTDWPERLIKMLDILLKGGIAPSPLALKQLWDSVEFTGTPHGHVRAVVATARRLLLGDLLDQRKSRNKGLAEAMIVAQVLEPRSELATGLYFDRDERKSTLGEELDLADADEDDLRRAMEWLLKRQDKIQRRLAKERIGDSGTALCYISRLLVEEREPEPEGFRLWPELESAYASKPRPRRLFFALLCDREGCPFAVQALDADAPGSGPLEALEALRDRLSLPRIALAPERTVPARIRIRQEALSGLDWAFALPAPATRKKNSKAKAADSSQLSLREGPNAAGALEPRKRPDGFSDAEVARVYKELRRVKQSFRSYRGEETNARAHVLQCMLAYYVEWHMRQALAPLLSGESKVPDALRGYRRSGDIRFRELLDDLALLSRVRYRPKLETARPSGVMKVVLTPLQTEAFRLLEHEARP